MDNDPIEEDDEQESDEFSTENIDRNSDEYREWYDEISSIPSLGELNGYNTDFW